MIFHVLLQPAGTAGALFNVPLTQLWHAATCLLIFFDSIAKSLHNFVTISREAVTFLSQNNNVKKKLRSLSSTAISAGLHLHGTRHLLMIEGMLPARIPMM